MSINTIKMDEMSDISKKTSKNCNKENIEKIRYKKYPTKYLNFYSLNNNFLSDR
jgi:hypothetical protein